MYPDLSETKRLHWRHALTQFSSICNFVYTSREFHPTFLSKTSEKTFNYVGPSLYSPPLSDDDKSFLQSVDQISENFSHFVYCSMGTLLDTAKRIHPILKSRFPPDSGIFFVISGLDASDSSENFICSPWVPQREILTRSSLFITHSGMNSTQEALSAAVPMIAIPHHADQHCLSERIQELKLGLKLDLDALGSLAELVSLALENEEYKMNIKHIQATLEDGAKHAFKLVEDFLKPS